MAKLKSGTRVYGDFKIDGGIYDSSNQIGIGGSVLISTGVGIAWTTSTGGGSQGIQGRQGLQGLQGTTGTGTQGIQGTQGISGGGGGGSITANAPGGTAYYPLFTNQTAAGSLTNINISTSKLTYNDSTGTLSATVFTSLSDETQKENIRPIENAIEMVSQMNGVYYDWIDRHNTGSVGVIAQEIEKILPEVVSTNDRGLKTVSYGNLVGVLIEAIKEQQVRIEELERKLDA